MALAFILSMPHNAASNGRWSGAGKCYAIVKPIGKAKKAVERAAALIAQKSFYYDFGDGWGASVTVREVGYNEACQLRRQTLGFYGYDWMVKSIWETGEIKPREKVVK